MRRPVAAIGVVVIVLTACGAEPTSPFAVPDIGPPPIEAVEPSNPPPADSPGVTSIVDAAPPDDAGQPGPPTSAVCSDSACLSAAIDYLVVTRPMFYGALDRFVEWKTGQGFSVGIASVDWLDEAFEGDHVAERMKTGMHSIRRASVGDDGTLYVLMVGDTQVVRADDTTVQRMLTSYDLSRPWNTPTGYYRRIDNDPEGEVLPSDAYFVEDSDWDVTGSGLNEVGGYYGQGEMVPTLYLGRWPARRSEDLEPIIDKTMQVRPVREALSISDSTLDDGYTCCDWPPTEPYIGHNNRACCYLDQGVIQNRLLEPADWLSWTRLTIDVEAEGPESFDALWDAEGAIFFTFHGYWDCVIMIANDHCDRVDDFHFRTVPPLLEAASCYIAAFYSGADPTLSEALFALEHGPAVFSQAGHNFYGYTENLMAGLPVGDAFWMAAETYVYWLNPVLLLGDPSLTIMTGPDQA
jgi:hypothetical protein